MTKNENTRGASKQGGFILPSIVLVIGGLGELGALVLSVLNYVLLTLPDPQSNGYAVEILVAMVLVCFYIFTYEDFGKRKRRTPNMVSATLLAGVFGFGVLLVFSLSAGAGIVMPRGADYYVFMLVAYLVAAAIMIPYFKLSKHVKAVFVK